MKAFLREVAIALAIAAIVTALSASLTLAGSFTINPPGLQGGTTAHCVGAQFGETPNISPWNAHFMSGGVVAHDLSCD